MLRVGEREKVFAYAMYEYDSFEGCREECTFFRLLERDN